MIIKKFNLFLLCASLFASPLAKACFHGIQDINERDDLLRTAFPLSDNDMVVRHVSSPEDYDNITDKLDRLIEAFPYDKRLNRYYGHILQNCGYFKGAADQFAHYILSDLVERNTLNFIQVLCDQAIKEQNHAFLKHIASVFDFSCGSIFQYDNPALTKRKGKTSSALTDISVAEHALPLFATLRTWCDLAPHEALLTTIVGKMESQGMYSALIYLIKSLYTQSPQTATPLTKLYYAYHCLCSRNFFKEAMPLYEEALGTELDADNPHQNARNYYNLAIVTYNNAGLVTQKGDYQEFVYAEHTTAFLQRSLDYLDKALVIGNSHIPLILDAQILMHMYLKNYDAALKTYHQLIALPEEMHRAHPVNMKRMHTVYLTALQKAGKDEEFSRAMEEKRKKVLLANEKLAARVKAAQHAYRAEQQALAVQKEEATRASAPKQTAQETADATYEYTPFSQPERYTPPVVIEKKKTRKAANPQENPQTKRNKTPVRTSSLISIEEITTNKNAIGTFYKLFDKYKNNVRSDSNVKISATEIDSFFEALEQPFEKSNGTSHQKATIKAQTFGSDIGDQMVILTSKSYLKPEQIKDLRLVFIAMRVVPADKEIRTNLHAEGSL